MAEAATHPLALEEALSWVGFKLDSIDGSSAGRVEGVLVDAEGGEPVWLAIRTSRLGRRTAIPFELTAGSADRAWVPYEKPAIKDAPEIDPGAGLDRARELELCEHFGLPRDSGRRAALAGREGEGPTAVPAS